MKTLCSILFVILLFACGSGRKISGEMSNEMETTTNDTIRKYYQNGQVHSEVFLKNGIRSGYVEYYFPSGELKMMTFPNSNRTLSFDRNGNIKSEFFYENGYRYNRKFSDNELVEESIQNDSFLWYMTWYPHGSPKSFLIRKKGSEIYCFKELNKRIPTDLESVVNCFCNGIPVIWNDSVYTTTNGQLINEKYTSQSIEYYEDGSIKKKVLKDFKHQVIKEWNMSGQIITDTVLSSQVTPVVQESGLSIPVFNLEDGGGPLLDTPTPLRDTLVQRIKLIYSKDTISFIHFEFTYHDSFGISHYSGSDIGIREVKDKRRFGIDKLSYHSNYTFYISGDEMSGVIVGVSKKKPKMIIFHVINEYWLSDIIEDTPIPLEMN